MKFKEMLLEAVCFLEKNNICPKHHVEHTGSNAYLLDFYDYLGEIEKGKKLVKHLLNLVVDSPQGGRVFYPGHMNPMNMSQNVIDTGTAVDTISRFMFNRRDAFSEEEHSLIKKELQSVVEIYLFEASQTKKVTNQRLWGLTGVASYAQYVGKPELFREGAEKSVTKAFTDMTVDGFFRYYPDPEKHLIPYDGMTTFYQSRHTAFIQYSLNALEMHKPKFDEEIEKSVNALLSMYLERGVKDMRMECKRWYWLSSYEVASHSFDAYALAHSNNPHASVALNNVLFQIRKHFKGGFLHSHKGFNGNFQCPIFWTAHLAWLTRIKDIETIFDEAHSLKSFAYQFDGEEIFTNTTKDSRVLVNSRWQERNPTTGIFANGLEGGAVWRLKIPSLPYSYWFSVREVVNHSWYALRGFHIGEAFLRLWNFSIETVIMILPRYSISYGKIQSMKKDNGTLTLQVHPASKYGTVLNEDKTIIISL